jgi:hypothetical protein
MAEQDNNESGDSGAAPEADPQIKAFEDIAARVSNKAASAHLSRFAPAIKKELMSAWEESLAPIRESLANLAKPREESDPKGDPELAKLKAENAKLAAQFQQLSERAQKAEAEKAKELETRLRQEEDRMIMETLAEAGVTGKRAQAVALLLREGKGIKRTEDGGVVYEMQGPGGYPDQVPLSEGVRKWLEADGKEFLPPRNPGGSGAVAASPGQPRGKRLAEMSPEERRKAKLDQAWSVLSGKPR